MDWKPVPNTDIKFEEMEVATACEEVTLRSESTISGMQSYLAVGTINNYGEEVSSGLIQLGVRSRVNRLLLYAAVLCTW